MRRIVLFGVAILMLAALAGPAIADHRPLEARYHLNDDASDSSGHAHDGTISGATFQKGKYGRALIFDGVNDEVSVPDADGLDFVSTDAMTLEMWLNPNASPEIWHALGKRDGCGSMNYQIARDPVSLLHFNSDGGPVSAGMDLPLNTWSHVAVTYDGASTLTIYVNGAQAGQDTAYTLSSPNDAPVKIGASGSCGNTFPGLLDEVRVWHCALPAARVAQHAKSNSSSGARC
jgi:hypothetical protein